MRIVADSGSIRNEVRLKLRCEYQQARCGTTCCYADKLLACLVFEEESIVSLDHEFIIVDKESNWEKLHSEFYKNKKNFEYVAIHDDYIQYFEDYFNFFTLYNPARNEEVKGLCYYGITKIPLDALESVIKMLKHILGIFEFAPDELNLTGNYVCGFAEKPNFTGNYEKGYFERLKISKEKFCNKLKDVIMLFSKAKNENKCIIHFGI